LPFGLRFAPALAAGCKPVSASRKRGRRSTVSYPHSQRLTAIDTLPLHHRKHSPYFCRMYKLPYFTEKDPVKMLAFMRQYPFAYVSGVSRDQMPVATQLPLFVDERDGKYWLSGHLMKNTDHHKAF